MQGQGARLSLRRLSAQAEVSDDSTLLTARRAKAAVVHRLLEAEYGPHLWRPHRDPLGELILTILSQHTSDVNSGRAFEQLIQSFPSWEAVRDAPTDQVAAAIRGGGLGEIKAPRIQAILRRIWEERGGFDLDFLRRLPLEEARAWLRSLPGVGPKTAACVLLFSLGLPALPVDTHVHRVSQRLGLADADATPEQAEAMLEKIVPPEHVYAFHLNLIALGRQICKAQHPRHEVCVVRDVCDCYTLHRRGAP